MHLNITLIRNEFSPHFSVESYHYTDPIHASNLFFIYYNNNLYTIHIVNNIVIIIL